MSSLSWLWPLAQHQGCGPGTDTEAFEEHWDRRNAGLEVSMATQAELAGSNNTQI